MSESDVVCVHCSADGGALESSCQLPVDGTPHNTVKWPTSTAEVATLPVHYSLNALWHLQNMILLDSIRIGCLLVIAQHIVIWEVWNHV